MKVSDLSCGEGTNNINLLFHRMKMLEEANIPYAVLDTEYGISRHITQPTEIIEIEVTEEEFYKKLGITNRDEKK